jgi:hypothetical protein
MMLVSMSIPSEGGGRWAPPSPVAVALDGAGAFRVRKIAVEARGAGDPLGGRRLCLHFGLHCGLQLAGTDQGGQGADVLAGKSVFLSALISVFF